MAEKKLLNIPANRKSLASLKEDSFVWFSLLISLFFIGILTIIIFVKWDHLPPSIPLFYSRPWGEKQLAPPSGLWLILTIAVSNLVLNFFLTVFAFKNKIVIRRILSSSVVINILLLTITTWKVINLIT